MRLELIGRMPDEDEEGRYRDTAHHYSTIDIAAPLVNLEGLIKKVEKKGRQFSYRDFPRSIFDDCEAALRCDPRPIDEYLDNYLSYTNFDALETRRRGFHGLNRVVLNATVTKKDNLSVRLWLKTLSDSGRWVDAPEWRDIPLFGLSGFMERPSDEVLFIRDVERLMVERIPVYERDDNGDPNGRKLVDAACELVNAIFWLTVQRLARRFEVTLARYLVLLRQGQGGRILGLDIVDVLGERKREIANGIARFQAETGWSPEEFWVACDIGQSKRRNYASDSVVRRLRAREGGTVKLTAGEVNRRLDFLSTADAYGMWKPARGAEPEKVVSLFPVTPKVDPPQMDPPPAPKAEKAAKPAPALVPYLPKTIKPAPQAARVSDEPPASRFDAPSYAGLRAAPWPDDLKREFAVESTMAFVAFVNDLRRAENRLPVPQGSFPAKASDLDKLVHEARLARARQQQIPPGPDESA